MTQTITVFQGDCLEILPTIASESVQCCVTSPPYWGLRDYGTATWRGGNILCDHISHNTRNDTGSSTGMGGPFNGGVEYFKAICGKCGAKRIDYQLGLEATPELYVANMVRVFKEVWRVLKDDGTLWLNIGDSYAANRTYQVIDNKHIDVGNNGSSKVPIGLKPKDLCGIPWRLAFALQADGWYLRSDIIWHKPNPMPESVTDRPTKSHEYIFLLTKQEQYYYDADAIKEPSIDKEAINGMRKRFSGGIAQGDSDLKAFGRTTAGLLKLDGQKYPTRNKRTVWTVTTQHFKGAHFATFPEKLITPCILAGSRVGDTILDPFGGSGTTGKVALDLGRSAVLIELNEKYVELINTRTNVTPGLLL